MIKRKKRVRRTAFFTLAFLLSFNLNASALSIMGLYSLNNKGNSDYKTKTEDLKTIGKSINTFADNIEYFNFNSDRDMRGLGPLNEYLVSHDIITRDLNIDVKGDSISTKRNDNDLLNQNLNVSRSDFLMALAKATIGVEKSRDILFKTKAVRNGKPVYITTDKPSWYNGNDNSFNYSEGDYYSYTTPNVYEQYLKKLLDKKIIDESSLTNEFKNEYICYGKDGKYPDWANNTEKYIFNGEGNPLGHSYIVNKDGIHYKRYRYFSNEKITTFEALQYVEKAMRLSEKDMTETEARMVSYKYGAGFLRTLTTKERKTTEFLIAKGVLNFENKSEFGGFYFDLNSQFSSTLLYRVANKDARLNFSEIQLTDEDNYWLQQSMHQKTLNLYKVPEEPSITNSEIKENRYNPNAIAYDYNPSDRMASNDIALNQMIATPDGILGSGVEYEVTRTFINAARKDDPIVYKYRGISIADKDFSSSKFSEVTKDPVDKGNNIDVTFKVKASSKESAIAILDANTETITNDEIKLSSVSALSKVTKGKEVSNFVSKSFFQLTGNTIVALADKYLLNTETGARAILMDNGIALVGNEVIHYDDTIVKGINGEVYYNMDIVSRLMSNAYLGNFGEDNVYITSYMNGNEYVLPVYSKNKDDEETDVKIGNTYGVDFNGLQSEDGSNVYTGTMYNITQMSSGLNKIIMDVSKDFGKPAGEIMMVVHFQYGMPGTSEINAEDLGLSEDPTMAELYEFFFKKPKSAKLLEWWNSNVGFNNALLNYVYGTSNVSYMRSGYVYPIISFLDNKEKLSNTQMNEFFSKFKYSGEFTNTKSGSNTADIMGVYFTNSKNSDFNSLYDLRTSSCIKGSKAWEQNGHPVYLYDKSFCMTAHKNIMQAPVFSTTYNSESKRLYVKTRNDIGKTDSDDLSKLEEKVSYNFKNNQWKLLGTTNDAKYILVTSKGMHAEVKDNKGKIEFYIDGGKKNLEDYFDELRGSSIFLQSNPSKHFWKSDKSQKYSLAPPLEDALEKDQLYYIDGKVQKCVEKDGKKGLEDTDLKPGKDEIKDVKIFPVMYLNQESFKSNKDGNIVRCVSTPAMEIQNVFTASITSNVIDSIVYKDFGYLSEKDIPNGSKVMIGDLEFKKTSTGLISKPIKNNSLLGPLVSASLGGDYEDISKQEQKLVIGTVGGIAVDYASKQTSDKSKKFTQFTLARYIKKSSISNYTTDSPKDGTLLKDTNGKFVVSSSVMSQYLKDSPNPKNFSITISLDDGIKFRPLEGKESNVYTMLTTTMNMSDGSLSDIPFFTGHLNYALQDENLFTFSSITYREPENLKELIQDFKDLWKEKMLKDTNSILRRYTIYVLMTIVLMRFICFIVLKSNIASSILYDLRNPHGKGGRKGIDWIKILSVGGYSIDDDLPPWYKVLIGNILLGIVISIVFLA